MPGSPPHDGQLRPGQPIPGQPIPGQPIPGQPIPGQLRPGQPIPGQHCRHCWGNCSGCLIFGVDSCVHQIPKLPWRARLRAARTRRFWRRVLFGPR